MQRLDSEEGFLFTYYVVVEIDTKKRGHVSPPLPLPTEHLSCFPCSLKSFPNGIPVHPKFSSDFCWPLPLGG